MSRKGENIYKRKDGRWEGRYIKRRNSAKTFYGYVYGKTYREAKMLLIQAKANVQANGIVPPGKEAKMSCSLPGGEHKMIRALPEKEQEISHFLPGENQDITLFQAAGEWLECKRSSFKESTLVKYQNMLQCYILPALGECRISSINRKQVKNFTQSLLNSGGRKGNGLSAKTVSDTLSLLRGILKFALENDIQVNYIACNLPSKQNPRPLRVFGIGEQQTLCKYLSENMTYSNLGILLSLFTGLRVGELCALKWGDISFSDRTLHVQRTMQRLQTEEKGGAKTKILISTPKSKCSERKIPLMDGILKRLSAMRKPPETFFLTGSQTDFMEPRTMQNRFKAVLRACGLADANFHALRHTFATRCVEAGGDAKSLSEILGHANVKITLNRYVHPTMEQKRENMRKLEQLPGITELFAVK